MGNLQLARGVYIGQWIEDPAVDGNDARGYFRGTQWWEKNL